MIAIAVPVAALVVAALFTGAAFYINFAEHPARMHLSPEQALAQWAPAYKRGYAMQASLAVLGGLLGLGAWWLHSELVWCAGAVLMLASWPWTLAAIMPVNRLLLAPPPGSDCAALLLRWNRLHGVRTLPGAGAMLCFMAGLAARV